MTAKIARLAHITVLLPLIMCTAPYFIYFLVYTLFNLMILGLIITIVSQGKQLPHAS